MIIECDNRKIKLSNQILKIIFQYIQSEAYDTEAGGIIVGRENLGNNNLILEYITEPLNGDVRTRKRFLRKDPGHLSYYAQLYNENDGIYAYFGEWHTHPEDVPRYSIIDLTNWKRISKEDPKKFQFHIIAGRKKITFWEMRREYLKPKLLYEEKWDEVIIWKNKGEY